MADRADDRGDVGSAEIERRRIKNAFVTNTVQLGSCEDLEIIARLYVRTGTSNWRSTTTSDVWQFFGPLYLKQKRSLTSEPLPYTSMSSESVTSRPQTETSFHQLDKSAVIDDSAKYCEQCLLSFQAGVASNSKRSSSDAAKKLTLSKITKYSKTTATSAMIRHLLDVHNITVSQSRSGGSADGFCQQKLKLHIPGASLSSTTSTQSSSLNNDLLMWLAEDNLPFSTVDTPAFHTVFSHQLPKVALPSSDTLRLTTLPAIYESLKRKVTSYLQSVTTICLMFDGWSDKHNARHFLGIRAAVIADDWSSNVITLSCKQCAQDSRSISEHVATELADIGLTSEVLKNKQLFTTHDGAAVMLKTSQLLKSQYTQHCCSHALHLLLMTDGINAVPALKELLTQCRNIVTKLHFKGDLVEEEMRKLHAVSVVSSLVDKVAAAFQVTSYDTNMPVDDADNADDRSASTSTQDSSDSDRAYRRLQQQIITRWNSALHMISSMLSLKNEVNEALKRTGHHELILRTLDWNILSQLHDFLKSFQTLTELASGNAVGLSVIPLIRAKVSAVCVPCVDDCDELAQLKRKLLTRLDVRFPMTQFVTIATLLDPASKNKKYLNMTMEQKRDVLIKAIETAAAGAVVAEVSTPEATAEYSTADSATSPPASKRLRIMDEFEDDVEGSDVVAMVTQYLSPTEKPSVEERADPLLYWKNSKHAELASLARTYLTANASSVPCESMFSISGVMLNGRRSGLAPRTFNRLIFIHDNAKYM